MSNYKEVAAKLDEATAMLGLDVTQEQMKFVREFLDAGEWGLALETLCDVLYENDIPLSAQTYKLINEAGRMMQMDESNWNMLQSQITVAA